MEISVIIPAYNESTYIVQTLKMLIVSLERASLIYEIIIIDSSDDDTTLECILSFKKRNNVDINIIRLNQRTFAGKARNIGVRECRYNNICFLDCGVFVEKDWCKKLIKFFSNNSDVDIVWSKSIFDPSDEWERSYIRSFSKKGYTKRYIRSCMMRKESFYKAGPFIEYVHSGEDLVFYSNVEKLGMIEIFSDAVSYYSHFPKNTKDIITKWSYFTKDNVVARKAYRKFIFAFMELASLFACILIYKWFGIQISVALFISLLISRITVQFFRADLKIIKIQEIPLTAYLVLIFDISRLAGMVWGVIFLLSKKTSGIKL